MSKETIIIKESSITSMCDAVREKSGFVGPMKIPEQVNEMVLSIEEKKEKVVYRPNDINFYDYKGNLVYSCDLEQAKTVNYPTPPEYKGLTFDCWNHDLKYIRTANRGLDIGALYYSSDQKFHAWYQIIPPYQDIYVALHLDANAYVDWGDGSSVDTMKPDSYYGMKERTYSPKHHYDKPGEYEITVSFDGKFTVAYPNFIVLYNYWHYSNVPHDEDWDMGNRVTKVWLPKEHWDPTFKVPTQKRYSDGRLRYSSLAHCDNLTEVAYPNAEISMTGFTTGLSLKINTIPPRALPIGVACYVSMDGIFSVPPRTGTPHEGTYIYFGAVKRLVIPDGVQSLERNYLIETGDTAEEIVLPHGFKLSSQLFSGFRNLKKINLDETITEIPDYCFSNCEQWHLPTFQNITKIGKEAFTNTNFTELVIPETLTDFSIDAFNDCVKLQKIVVPSYMTNITNWLQGCTRLTIIEFKGKHITVADNVELFPKQSEWSRSMCIITGDVVSIGAKVFYEIGCEIILPDSIEFLGVDCFNGADFSFIKLPDSLVELKDGVLARMPGLQRVIMPSKIQKISATAFTGSFRDSQHYGEVDWTDRYLDFSKSTSVPILDGYDQFSENRHNTLEFRVPKSLLEEWKTAPNWSNLASKIVPAEEGI